MDFLTTLTAKASPRASATEQEEAAAEYLVREFEALGYQARLQPFTVQLENTRVSVVPSGQGKRDIESIAMSLSGRGSASGALVNVGKAFQEDIPPAGLGGKIALIQRGDITFEEKVSRVAQAGAVAALVYNNAPGLFRGAMSQQAAIPAVTISQDSGEAILALTSSAEVSASISVEIQERSSHNVIAEKPGAAGDGRAVVLGGHYDTVPAVPGANDNGSGTAAFMTIAREVANRSYPFTLRFMGFGSEELGLEGSSFYVNSLSAQERENIIAMLNFDALGTGPVLGVMGDADLVARVIERGQKDGVDVARRFGIGGGSSDHASFQQAGIPVAFFLADDFSRIHTPEDRLEFVRPELLGNAAALGIALLDSLAER
jgi:aminopeptidase YwaD